MQTKLLEISGGSAKFRTPDVQLSFQPFLNHLRARIKNQDTLKSQYYQFVLDKFEKLNASTFSLQEVEKYRELLEIIYFVLTPLVSDDKHLCWALGTPFPGELFYTTDEFYSLFCANLNDHDSGAGHAHKKKKHIGFIYGIILDRFYGVMAAKDELIFPAYDSKTGLTKYYQVEADMQFVNIEVKGKLPELTYDDLKLYLQENDEAGAHSKSIEKVLPLDLFRFEGFSVITLRDITDHQAIESIKDVLANHYYDHQHVSEIIQSLKTMIGTRDVGFGLLPLLEVNDKPVIVDEEYFHSIVFDAARKQGLTEVMFEAFVSDYREKQTALIFHDIQHMQSDLPFVNMLRDMDFNSYGLFPVKYHGKLTGMLEMYTKKSILFDEKIISKIQPAMPLLAQLLNYMTEKLTADIDTVVMQKFTPLQESVQWKFKEAAWKHLQQNKSKAFVMDIEPVQFQHVYPLYGAIDVRNSTLEHSKAAQDDITIQLQLLKNTFEHIDKQSNHEFADELSTECDTWMIQLNEYFTTKDEITLNGFLLSEVHPYLVEARNKYPEAAAAIDGYFEAIAEPDGVAYQKRSRLENSLHLINASVNQNLEADHKELQMKFPFYFEKFRTDGIEYDIYVGASISSGQKFEMQYLKQLRLWQLRSMAGIARITKKLLPEMPTALRTTQLIFVHSSPIDISFRNDERRFDVEGAYNIRYEVIKKRIDKAVIKGTSERLTQPDKIAIAYFNLAEQKEYLSYILELQQEKILDQEVEYLELEELHGVSGIRALRVSVLFETIHAHTNQNQEKKLVTL